MDRREHPSGRPIRHIEKRGLSIWRVPEEGFVTPRLRQSLKTEAIGFLATASSDQADEE